MQLPLMSADEIYSMVQGEAIYRGTENIEKFRDPRDRKLKQRIRPWHLSAIPLPSNYQNLEQQCEALYTNQVYPWLVKTSQKRTPNWDLQAEIRKREELAQRLLPLPPQSGDSSKNDLIFDF